MSKQNLDVPNFAFALRVAERPFSRFHRYVAQGILPGDWAADASELSGRFGE